MKNTVKIQYQFTGVQTLSKTSVSFRIKVKIFMWLSSLYDQNLCCFSALTSWPWPWSLVFPLFQPEESTTFLLLEIWEKQPSQDLELAVPLPGMLFPQVHSLLLPELLQKQLFSEAFPGRPVTTADPHHWPPPPLPHFISTPELLPLCCKVHTFSWSSALPPSK